MFVAFPHQALEMAQVLYNDQQISIQMENYNQVVLCQVQMTKSPVLLHISQ